MRDKIVLDIETKDSFDDVGGRENLKALSVSVVGVYSYNQDRYFCFDDKELDKLGELLKGVYLLLGFSIKRFDLPVLEKYFNFNLDSIPCFDILDQIENTLGRRISLDLLAQANLGIGKTGHGLQAIELYRNGEIARLKEYCLQDVKITKDIYEYIKAKKFVWIPQKYSPEMIKLPVNYEEPVPPPASLL